MNEGPTSVVTLALFGLMTGFLLSPADRKVSSNFLPQEQIFLMSKLVLQPEQGILGYKVTATIRDM